jgi:hypothetical protein
MLTWINYSVIIIFMKVRFLNRTIITVENPEVQDENLKSYNKWDEFFVDRIDYSGSLATIFTYDGFILLNVPVGSFQVIEKKNKVFDF